MIKEMGCESTLVHLALRRLRESESFRAELPTLPGEQRVVRTLLRLAVSPSIRHHQWPAEVPLGQKELGHTVGLSRGVVSAELAKLRSLGLIETSRGRIFIKNLDGLRRKA